MRFTHTIIALFLSITLWNGQVWAEYYRWVDKNGDTQYGDQVPVEDTQLGRELVNKEGQVVEKVEPARSPEEQRKFEEVQRIANLQRQKVLDQEAYDRVLLATFNSVEEIENVRDERVSLIEQSINLSKSRLRKQEKELSKLNESRTRFIDRDMQPPEWISKNEAKVLTQIEAIEEYVRNRTLEKEKLKKQFNKDIARYKELTKLDLTAR